MWIDVKKDEPKVDKTDFGFASRYVLVRINGKKGNIVNARLEGKTETDLYWYSPLFDDQVDNVIEWMDIPVENDNKKTRNEVIDVIYKLLKATGKEIKAEMKDIPDNPHIVFDGDDLTKWIKTHL